MSKQLPQGFDSRLSISVEYRKETLSPTAIDYAMTCGRKLQFYLDPDQPRGGTNLNLARGHAWHWMMEQWGRFRLWAQEYRPDVENPVELLDQEWLGKLYSLGMGHLTETMHSDEYEAHPKDDSFDEVADQLWTMLKVWSGNPHYMWMGDGITFQTVEARVLTEMGSDHHQMQGYLDAVVEIEAERDKELEEKYPGIDTTVRQTVLVDYKSAGRAWGTDRVRYDEELGRYIGDPRKIVQAPLYAEAWERATGDVVQWVCFDVMTIKGKFMRVWVPVAPAKREPLLVRWRQVSDEIQMYREAGVDMPANPGHFLCSSKWCPYWDRCPLGEPYERDSEESEKQR